MYRMGIMALISSDIPGVNRDKFDTHNLLLFGSYDMFHSSFFVAVFGLLQPVSKRYFDTIFLYIFRCIKMAIVHDIAEGEIFFPVHSLIILCFNVIWTTNRQ